jgi:hypothetical protein
LLSIRPSTGAEAINTARFESQLFVQTMNTIARSTFRAWAIERADLKGAFSNMEMIFMLM